MFEMRIKLRNGIRQVYRTQNKCAYEIGICNATISRIIQCTLDPTEKQIKMFITALGMNRKDIMEKM